MNSFFGLPEKVKYCKNCLLSNQKPISINENNNSKKTKKIKMSFEKNGICSACEISEKKKKIDWKLREKKLLRILDKYRKNNNEYDCIIPGSGGKDSMYTTYMLKHKYNMNPLTVTQSPILPTKMGLKNFRSWINYCGVNNILASPNARVTAALAREAFINLLHPMQPFKFGIKTVAVKEALRRNIKLIFYGEPYSEYGSEAKNSDKKATYNFSWFTNKKEDNYIGGLKEGEIKRKYNWIKESDLRAFASLEPNEIKGKKLQVEFLGWYLKWDPQEIYYFVSKYCGFEPDYQRTEGSYGRYTGIDDKFDWLHFYCSFIKFGIGRCRQDASQEIRNGHITRDEGIMLCKKFESEGSGRFFKDCYEFMNLSEKDANKIIDNFRSPHLWRREKGKWSRLQLDY